MKIYKIKLHQNHSKKVVSYSVYLLVVY